MISVHGITNEFFLIKHMYLSKLNICIPYSHLNHANINKEALEFINECFLISD